MTTQIGGAPANLGSLVEVIAKQGDAIPDARELGDALGDGATRPRGRTAVGSETENVFVDGDNPTDVAGTLSFAEGARDHQARHKQCGQTSAGYLEAESTGAFYHVWSSRRQQARSSTKTLNAIPRPFGTAPAFSAAARGVPCRDERLRWGRT
jgi:hypothetical protein